MPLLNGRNQCCLWKSEFISVIIARKAPKLLHFLFEWVELKWEKMWEETLNNGQQLMVCSVPSPSSWEAPLGGGAGRDTVGVCLGWAGLVPRILSLIQGSNLYLLGISLILWIDSVESLLTIRGMFVLQKIFVDRSCESMLMLYALLEFWALLYVFSVVDMLFFCFTWGVKIIMKSSVCSAGPVRSASATSVRSGEEW